MGVCVSKLKKRRRHQEDDPYTSFDGVSYTYEDVENFDQAHVYVNMPTRDDDIQQAPQISRSITSISTDSAYSDTTNNHCSRNVSLTSVNEDTEGCKGPISYGDIRQTHRKPLRRQRSYQSSNTSYESSSLSTYKTFPRRDCSLRSKEFHTQGCDRDVNTTIEIPYMIDVFLPLLQDSIRVMDIIPHLSFIDDIVTFRNKDRESPRDAVVLLIQRIKACEEQGKWQTFLEALFQAGYKYIHDLLKGETEQDHTTKRRLLRLFTPRLIRRMDPQEFIDHLYERNVIDETDMEEIKCVERNRGPTAASLMLLECLPRKNQDWYNIFVDVLTICGLDDMVGDFKLPADTDANVTTKSCAVQSTENHYLTPVYETDFTTRHDVRPSPVIKDPTSGTNISDNHTLQPATSQVTDNSYVTSSNFGYECGEIVRLKAERDSLLEQVKQTREEKQLKKEIYELKKELLSLQNDDEFESKTINDKLDDDRETNGIKQPLNEERHGIRESSCQTNESDILLTEILREIKELNTRITVKEDAIMEETGNSSPVITDICFPSTFRPTHIVPLYSCNPKDTYVSPVPHKSRRISYFDSGLESMYLSMFSLNG